MDILSARKKAAKQAKARQKEPEAEPAAPAQEAEQTAPQPQEPLAAAAAPAEEAAPAVAAAGAPLSPPAEQPASAPEGLATEVPELEMLSVFVGNESYAVPVELVWEVLRPWLVTPVPHVPEHYLGVISLRGSILPVIDLAKRLGLPPTVRGEKSRIIVVSVDDEKTGILVDRVAGVVRFPADAVRPVPETVEKGAEFLTGIVRKHDQLYILLDLARAAR